MAWVLGFGVVSAGCLRSVPELPAASEGGSIDGTLLELDAETGTLRGSVQAVVRVVGTSISRSTDERGFFQLTGVPLGYQSLAIEKRVGTEVVAARVLEPIHLFADRASVSLGEIELSPGGEVQGKISLSDHGNPGGSIVSVARTGLRAIVGEDGGFVIPSVPQGAFDVVAFHAGYDPGRLLRVGVGPGARTLARELVLVGATSAESPVAVTGSAVRIGDADSDGIHIEITSERTASVTVALLTESSGAFMTSLLPGVYRVRASQDGYIPAELRGVVVLKEAVVGLTPIALAKATNGDLDGDGILDANDLDLDNDGCANAVDKFPQDPFACLDHDLDGIPDEIDPDDDNDGVPDAEEVTAGLDRAVTSPFKVDTDADGFDDASDNCPDIQNMDQRDTDGDGFGDACSAPAMVGGSTVTGPPAIVRGFSPASGTAGQVLTVYGTDFVPDARFNLLRFGSSSGIVQAEPAATSHALSFVVPRNAASGPLTVISGATTVTSTGSFTFLAPPEVVSISPSSARRGAMVAVFGRGFGDPQFRIELGGTILSTEACAPGAPTISGLDRVCFRVPSNGLSGHLVAHTLYGTSDLIHDLIVLAGARIARMSPNPVATGQSLTITGEGFSVEQPGGMPLVRFSGAAMDATPTGFTDTALEVLVPTDASSGRVTLVHPAGNFTSVDVLTINSGTPSLATVAPPAIMVGETITLGGSGLNTTIGVLFPNATATVAPTNVSVNSVSVVVPPGVEAGIIQVVLSDGTHVAMPARTAVVEMTSPLLTTRPVVGVSYDSTGVPYSLEGTATRFLVERDPVTLAPRSSRDVSASFPLINETVSRLFGCPSGTCVAVLETDTTGSGLVMMDFPSLVPRGRCNALTGGAYVDVSFDPLERFAYFTVASSSIGGSLIRVDVASGNCDRTQLQDRNFGAMATSNSEILIYSQVQGSGAIVSDPGAPWDLSISTPFVPTHASAPVVGGVWLSSDERLMFVAINNSVLGLVPFDARVSYRMTTSANSNGLQSRDRRWLVVGGTGGVGTLIDLDVPGVAHAALSFVPGGVFGNSFVGRPGTALGIVRLTIHP
ncbi:MAG: carboxypeptidase-like regulatory domain-containing protein [Myxococcota bacterium]